MPPSRDDAARWGLGGGEAGGDGSEESKIGGGEDEKAAADLAQDGPVKVEVLVAEVAALKQQLKGKNTRIATLRQRVAWAELEADKRVRMVLTKPLYRHARACMHPDRAPKGEEKLWTKYAQEFNGLKVKLVDQ